MLLPAVHDEAKSVLPDSIPSLIFLTWTPLESLPDVGWQAITFASIVIVVVQGCALYSILHALRFVRTSQAAVGWTVALLTLPFLTLPLYWVFARHRFHGYREAIREVGLRHQRSVSSIRGALHTERNVRSTENSTPLECVADVLDAPITTDNRYELLVDGKATFDAIIKAINEANRYIYIAFFIIRDDGLGNRFADALIERATAGVTVRVVYDEVGSHRLSYRYVQRLTDAGVEILTFNTRQGWFNRFQINFRNHRKLVLVDGNKVIVGGLNVGDEYLGECAGKDPWRDTAISVEGMLARQAQAVFAGDYYWAARKDLPEADWNSSFRSGGSGRAAVCATGPADPRPRGTMMFAAAAQAAKERLWISTPYLVPDNAVVVALHMAKARGVDVRILIPAKADHYPVYLAGFFYEQELGEADIPVYRYQTGFLHQKCLLVDDRLAMVGSTNLDNRSLHLNFELMVAVEDQALVAAVSNMLTRDFDCSVRSNASDAPVRWWFERAGTAVARLFSPIL